MHPAKSAIFEYLDLVIHSSRLNHKHEVCKPQTTKHEYIYLKAKT